MAEGAKPKLSVHPLLAHLADSGQQSDQTIVLSGYVGPASGTGQVRLYSSLEDLSHFIEFDEGSVVFVAPAAKSVAPHKGVTVWLKSSAPIRWTRDYKNAKTFWTRVAKLVERGTVEPPGVLG